MNNTYRKTQLIAALVCCFLLAFAYYLEIVRHLPPCPLCLMQRGIYLILALLFFLGASIYGNVVWRRLQLSLSFFVSCLGILLAGRQLWLEHTPHTHASGCAASVNYLLQHLSLQAAFNKLIAGSPECIHSSWSLLGFGIAAWSLFFLVIFALLTVKLLRTS